MNQKQKTELLTDLHYEHVLLGDPLEKIIERAEKATGLDLKDSHNFSQLKAKVLHG